MIVDEETFFGPGDDLTDSCLYPFAPFIYELTMIALDGQAFEDGSLVLDSETFIVLPDFDSPEGNRMFDVNWALPDGTVDVEFQVSTLSFYANRHRDGRVRLPLRARTRSWTAG